MLIVVASDMIVVVAVVIDVAVVVVVDVVVVVNSRLCSAPTPELNPAE